MLYKCAVLEKGALICFSFSAFSNLPGKNKAGMIYTARDWPSTVKHHWTSMNYLFY